MRNLGTGGVGELGSWVCVLCSPAFADVAPARVQVAETLRYAAQLRIAGLSGTQLADRVRAVISLLRLGVVADSLVGNALKRGVSGGEKKRV